MTQEENKANITAVIALIEGMPAPIQTVLAEKAVATAKGEAREAAKVYVSYIKKFRGYQNDFLDLLSTTTSESLAEEIKADLVTNQQMIERSRRELHEVRNIIKKMDSSTSWKEILTFFTEMP